jgi:hypothetical protein
MRHHGAQEVPTQINPVPQVVPESRVDQAEVETVGEHTWQAFVGLNAPGA